MVKSIVRRLKALHEDEQGADMVEYILVVAAIALPLLGVVVWFWQEIKTKAIELWERIWGAAEQEMPGG